MSKSLKSRLNGTDADAAVIVEYFARNGEINVYPSSVNGYAGNYWFIGRKGSTKSLYMLILDHASFPSDKFPCNEGDDIVSDRGITLVKCALDRDRASSIRELFPFTIPQKIRRENSFGFGDRLGIATPGHIRALRGTAIWPVFAQQSIRELERTVREPQEVIDAATWGVFQEGWRDGYGADADHLKTTADIDRMARAGFTMFTIDPGEYVNSMADSMPSASLLSHMNKLDWVILDDTIDAVIKRYDGQQFNLPDGFTLRPDGETILRAVLKYGNVIAHTIRMHRHLAEHWPGFETEIELSVDETDTATSPFEHFLIANELKRRGICPVSIAPRFIGDFEKGIDYRGDIARFRGEYRMHIAIANALGPYKLSLHSGSDKFSVYEVIGKLPAHHFHIKTAGTSYLVALETVARTEPALFRDILAFSRDRYEVEKRSYHVSADLANVPDPADLPDADLPGLFMQDDTRQVLHVAFGKVLTTCNEDGDTLFRNSIMRVLDDHEELHYKLLKNHFERHLTPLMCD